MGRPIWELRETMPHDEWDRWLTFHSLYDLPDGYFVVAQICLQLAGIMGEKGARWADYVPYHKPEETPRGKHYNASLANAFAWARANGLFQKPKPG